MFHTHNLWDKILRLRLLLCIVLGLMIVSLFESNSLFTIGAPPSNPVAWGDNSRGQLGDNSHSPSSTPVQVSGLTGITAVAAGNYHSLAVKSDGTVWAWGLNTSGQLGNNSTTPSIIPVRVSGLTGVTAVAGGRYHSLALKSDGTVWAWGLNSFGQLGINTGPLRVISRETMRSTPVQVSGLTGVTAITAGEEDSLALKSDGTVWAWGSNEYGQLGNNSTTPSNTPVQVSGLSGVTAIAAGGRHNLALESDGTVRAWGDNTFGQLGNNRTAQCWIPLPPPACLSPYSGTAVEVSGLTGVTVVAGGSFSSLAVKSDGTVWAWGWPAVFSNNSPPNSSIPGQVNALAGITAVAGGGTHSLAVKSDGTVWAWGSNAYGQLGGIDIGWSNNGIPVQVEGLTGVVAVSGGVGHSLAIGAIPFAATAPRRLPCQLSAAYNLMPRVLLPGKPDTEPIFSVGGKCTFPTPGFSVDLKPHTPSSPDPKILLLDAIVHAPTNPGPQVRTDVPVRYTPPLSKTSTLWEKVIILPDNWVLSVGRAS